MTDLVDTKFGPLYDDLVKLMKLHNLTIAEMAASCLSFFLTFADATVPKSNRVALVQKIAKDLQVSPIVR